MSSSRSGPAGQSWTSQPEDLEIGEIRVQPRLLQVLVDGHAHRLEPKTMKVLLRLAASPGQAVTRQELLASVWPDVHVTEDVLNRSVYQLRKLVGDDPRKPSYIETIPTVGYRLLAAVTAGTDEPPNEASRSGERIADRAPTSGGRAPSRPPGTRRDLPAAEPRRQRPRRRAVAAVAATIALGLLAWSLTRSPSPAGVSQRNSVDRWTAASRPPERDIRVAPLFPGPGHQILPALSPDGHRVAFSALSEAGDWDLFVGLVTESMPVRRTESGDADMAAIWSSDGTQLAWIRYSQSGCAIYRGPYFGREEGKVADCLPATGPRLAWSPDGATMVYGATGKDGAARLWKLDVTTGKTTPLTRPPAGLGGDYLPVFSRDGAWLAFVRGTVLGSSDIYFVAAAGGAARRITHENMIVSGVDFSPVGDRVLFLSNRGGDFGLWAVPTAGGAPEWLGHSGPVLEDLAVAARSHRIALVAANGRTELWEGPISAAEGGDEGEPDRLRIASSRHDRGGQYSPDGKTLAWVSSRSGSPEIWVAADGETPVRKTRFGSPYLGTPRWSPDGRSLLFEAQTAVNADLFLLRLGEDGPRAITHGSSHEIAPRWSAGGRSVLFASDRGGRWQVWRMTLASRFSRQVTADGGFAACESLDGRWLYYTKADRPGLWMTPVEGSGAERRLVSDLETADWRTVVPVPGGVLYARRVSRLEADLMRVEPRSGRVVTLRRGMQLPPFSALDRSPDGNTLLFSRLRDLDGELYLLENLL